MRSIRISKNADAFFSSFRSYDLQDLEDEKIFIRKSSNLTRSRNQNGGDDFPGTGSNGPGSPGAGIQGPGQLAPPEAASVIRQNADPLTLDRFSTALHLAGKEISSLAYVMIIQMSGITTTGPAVVTMNVPLDWVDRNGGNGAVTIVRAADDGTTEVLTTTFDGYNSITGYPRFRAESPHGLSTFGLIVMKAFIPQQSPGTNQSAPVQTPAQPAATPPLPENLARMSGMITAGGIVAMFVIISIALGMYTRKTR